MSVKKQNDIIAGGLKSVNSALAGMYAGRAQATSRKAVQASTLARSGTDVRRNADIAIRSARDSRSFATRARSAAGRAR